MSEKTLFAVTGLLGAGKTTVINTLVEKHGYETRYIGGELARLHRQEHGLPDSFIVPGLACMDMHRRIRQTDPTYFERFITEGTYTRRVIDGLRNLSDARHLVAAGGFIVALVAPRPERLMRRQTDTAKDPSFALLVEREMAELDDRNPHGSQALRVMALSETNGFAVDASQPSDSVIDAVLSGIVAYQQSL